jgi:hypothetical protein
MPNDACGESAHPSCGFARECATIVFDGIHWPETKVNASTNIKYQKAVDGFTGLALFT